ncbi:hypothetical protein V6N13_109523 [Hibiscus sabdariffa]
MTAVPHIQATIDCGVPLCHFVIVGKDRNEGDPPEFQFGPWLKVESAQPKATNVRRSWPGIVFTRKDDGAANPLAPTSVEGALTVRVVQSDREKEPVTGVPKAKSSKRSHTRNDGEGLHSVSKKAHLLQADSGNNFEEGQEETSPQMSKRRRRELQSRIDYLLLQPITEANIHELGNCN